MAGQSLHYVAGAWVYRAIQPAAPAQPAPLTPAEQVAENNGKVLAQIAGLESMQARPLRELMLNQANTFARDKLIATDVQIAQLRSQLMKV